MHVGHGPYLRGFTVSGAGNNVWVVPVLDCTWRVTYLLRREVTQEQIQKQAGTPIQGFDRYHVVSLK